MRSVVALSALLAFGVSQASARTEYEGGLCFVAMTSACTAVGWNPGFCTPFRYRPPNLTDNGPSTRLAMFQTGYASSYALASGTLIGTVFKAVSATVVAGGGFQFAGATMRLTTQLPPTLTATTAYVYFTGSISRWDNIPGCTVTFRGSGTLRP